MKIFGILCGMKTVIGILCGMKTVISQDENILNFMWNENNNVTSLECLFKVVYIKGLFPDFTIIVLCHQ